MNWRETIKDSRIKLFPGDCIHTLGEDFEVIEVAISTIDVRYKLANFRTGAAFEASSSELEKWKYRRLEC